MLDGLDTALHRLFRLISSRQSGWERLSGLPVPQYMVLRTIAGQGPQRMSDIAALLGVKSPAVSMIVQGLEGEELVVRAHDDSDNRVVRVSLTDLGRRKLEGAEELRRELVRRFTADLDDQEVRSLVGILAKLCNSVAREG